MAFAVVVSVIAPAPPLTTVLPDGNDSVLLPVASCFIKIVPTIPGKGFVIDKALFAVSVTVATDPLFMFQVIVAASVSVCVVPFMLVANIVYVIDPLGRDTFPVTISVPVFIVPVTVVVSRLVAPFCTSIALALVPKALSNRAVLLLPLFACILVPIFGNEFVPILPISAP